MNDLDHPRTRSAFRGVGMLVGCYVGLSALTMVAAVLLSGHRDIVTDAVWVRGTIVLVSSLLTLTFAVRAARGSRPAYKRLRILTAAMVVAIAVIVSLPGVFPVWMRVEQAACGLLLLGVVVIVNGRHLRALYAAK